MSCESSLSTNALIPRAIAFENSSMIALYYAILLVVCPKHIPCKLTNSSLGEKSAHVAEDRFRVL